MKFQKMKVKAQVHPHLQIINNNKIKYKMIKVKNLKDNKLNKKLNKNLKNMRNIIIINQKILPVLLLIG